MEESDNKTQERVGDLIKDTEGEEFKNEESDEDESDEEKSYDNTLDNSQ